MKRLSVICAVALLAAFACANIARAEDKAEKAKTITGKSACATCSGVTSAGHNVMIVDSDGMRWVLLGDNDSYKAAHKERKNDKKMTATLDGEPVVKKDSDGKEYKEVKVKDIKIEA